MKVPTAAPASPWADAALAAALFAVDPAGTVGVALRASPGPVRERWLALLRDLLPAHTPVRRIPLQVTDGRLLGGLDLAATLRAGRPIGERGILAEAHGGVVLLAMAERLAASTAARLSAVLDSGEVAAERDGMTLHSVARIGVVALDEGIAEDERPPSALLERFAFHLDLGGIGISSSQYRTPVPDETAAARARLPAVHAAEEIMEALCAVAMALGIASIRAPLLALRVARAAAALDGRSAVTEEDAAIAGRLVLAPRATVLPAAEPSTEEGTDDPSPDEASGASSGGDDAEDAPDDIDRPLEDIVLEAAQAAIPAALLASLRQAGPGVPRSQCSGRAGALQQSAKRGRPIGARRGEPRAGARLNVVETLRAAAPWQRLRRRDARPASPDQGRPARLEVRREDFHVARFKHRTETTTIFVVDASGSSALHRLAEAKGAVELLLADCYVRRDRVALLAFRGRSAELLLPPTRSLLRAKRSLAGLPGGGGTPLASGLAAAAALADAVRRRGETPVIVLLTDGRANIARDGSAGGRARAEEDALAAARVIRAAGLTALLVDTSPQPQPLAQRLAAEMGATYLPLPHAGAAVLSQAVRGAALPPRRRGAATA